MKALITAAALAAAVVSGLGAFPARADGRGHFWHGPAQGPRWRAWRRAYVARWRRPPVRVCRHTRCWYR